ncbi:MAG: hypothetical protein K9L64_05955 [Candidatus Izimaplasma sp.]|nr:hypothetical protein [Candidatus Izimaplasma bacterium]
MDEMIIREYISIRNEYQSLMRRSQIVVLFRMGKVFRLLKELKKIFNSAIIDLIENQNVFSISELTNRLNKIGIVRFNRYFDFPWKKGLIKKLIKKLIKYEQLSDYYIDLKSNVVYKKDY